MPCSKRMRSCYSGCLHRRSVLEYRDSRDAWELGRENGDGMQMEDDEYRARFPPPTFKKWLQEHARSASSSGQLSADGFLTQRK